VVLGRERGVSRTIPDWSVLDSLWVSRLRDCMKWWKRQGWEQSFRKSLNTNHRQKMMSV